MKKLIILIYSFFLIIVILSCNPEDYIDTNNSNTNTDTTTAKTELATDYIWNSDQITKITLNNNTIEIIGSGASATGNHLTIAKSGNYEISGTLTDGYINVNTTDSLIVRLILKGVSIYSSETSPLLITDAQKVVVILADNSTNTFTDNDTYSINDIGQNATIFSKSYLSFFGNGKLVVNSKMKDAIHGKDGLVIKSGTFNIACKDDAIVGKDYLTIHDGNFNIIAQGDGIKSDNDSDTNVGIVTVNKGIFNITSGGDALSAINAVNINDGTYEIKTGSGSGSLSKTSARGIKSDVNISITGGNYLMDIGGDAIKAEQKVNIEGGTFNISTADDGIQATNEIFLNAEITINKSDEGITAKFITVNGGNYVVYSTDDSFNTSAGSRTENNDGSNININQGRIVLSSSDHDPLDSNGSIEMKGGIVIIHGPKSAPEVCIDYNGTFNITGGFLIASGTNSNMTQAPSTSSTVNSLKITTSSTISASTLFHIEDSSGNTLATFSPLRAYSSIIFTSSDLKKGSSYKIFTGGSDTGTNKNGLYANGTYSGGTLKKTFTVSGTVTNVSI